MPAPAHLIADKGYDSTGLRQCLEDCGTEPIITPRSNRKIQNLYDKTLNRHCNIIEQPFNRLKNRRRIAARLYRAVKDFFAALRVVAAIILWL